MSETGAAATPNERAFIEWNVRESLQRIWRHPITCDNLLIVALVASYALIVSVVHHVYGNDQNLTISLYSGLVADFCICSSLAFLLPQVIAHKYKRYLQPRALIGFLIVFAVTPVFKSAFASYKQMIPLVHDFCWDMQLMRWDQFLHFGHHPWRILEPLLRSPRVLACIDFLYMVWFVVLFLLCLWMAWTHRRRLRLCFFVSTILVWTVLGSALGTVFSSAGPCYYAKAVTEGENPYEPLMSRLNEVHQKQPLWAITNQDGLWYAKVQKQWLPFGGISAMPSIHLAMATIYALVGFSVRKWLGVVFTGYLVIIQIGSVILGWHYALDGYAGIVLTYLIWIGTRRALNRMYSGNSLE